MNLDTDITLLTKINSKWITELNVKHKTIKLLEDNTGENIDDVSYSDDFLDLTSKAQSMKEVIDKVDITKIKNLCSAIANVKRVRRQDEKRENICKKTYLTRVTTQNIQGTLKTQ